MPTYGAYFIVADVSTFLREGETDEVFAKRLTIEAGVTTIPVGGWVGGWAGGQGQEGVRPIWQREVMSVWQGGT